MIQYDYSNTSMKQDIKELLKKKEINTPLLSDIIEIVNTDEDRFIKREEFYKFVDESIKGNETTIFLTRSIISDNEFPPDKWCLDYQKAYTGNEEKLIINDTEVINRENDILKDAGFVDINELVGYEYGHAFIYPNTSGRFIIDKIYKDKDRDKISAYITTYTNDIINDIILAESLGKIELIEPRDENGEPDYYGEFEVVKHNKKYVETGLEKEVLMWANDYLDTDAFIDFAKAYDKDYLRWNLRKVIDPVPCINNKDEFKDIYINLDETEDENDHEL